MDSIPDSVELCPAAVDNLRWIENELKAIKVHRKSAKNDLKGAAFHEQLDLQILASVADDLATIKARANAAQNIVEFMLNIYTRVPPKEE